MKHLAITLAVVALLAIGAAAVTYQTAGDPAIKAALSQDDSLEWLRVEFDLNETEFARIQQLHNAYSVVCEEHCRDIQRATRTRNELKRSASPDDEAMAAAEQRLAQLRRDCETAITAHVRACAKLMPPAKAERYLALVLPKIADFDHHAAPNLELSAHQH